MDTSGFEMQAIIFDETIERLSPILEEGNIYYIKGGYAKFNDKRFTNIKTDYRLIFDYNTQVTQVNKNLDTYFEKNEKDKTDIVKFEDLHNCKQNQVINCLAYILQIFPVMNKQSRIGNVLMRKLILCDSSLYKVQFTLWNKFTELDLKQGNILLLKYIRVGTYNNNICLTTIDNSYIDINPNMVNCKEYDDLQKIISVGINEEDFKYISENEPNNRASISEKTLCNNDIIYINTLIKILQNKFNDSSPRSDCSMMFTIKATVLQFEHGNKNFYLGCPNKMCRKKLIQKDEDYYCPGCETITTEISYYYILNLRVIDISGEHTINLFGDQVTNLFGIDAKTYSDLIDNNEEEKLKEITKNIEYQTYYFYGKANIVKYGNRVKTQLFVYKFEKEDFKKDKKRILGEIQECLNNIK
jgi:replication factor A1